MPYSDPSLPDLRWDDLAVVLAIARTGSMTAASELLKINPSTVQRRLTALEGQLGVRIFDRHTTGLSPTVAGEQIVPLAEHVEEGVFAVLRAAAGQDQSPRGRLRLTAPESTLGVLTEPLMAFRRQYPDIELQLTFSDRFFDLGRREADVALRFSNAPPEEAIATRVASVAWAVYAPTTLLEPESALPWITYSDDLAGLGAVAWWNERYDAKDAVMCVNSVPAMKAALLAAGCRGLLPCFIADPERRLRRLTKPIPEAASALWILIHPDLRTAARVKAIKTHLAARMGDRADLFEGQLSPHALR